MALSPKVEPPALVPNHHKGKDGRSLHLSLKKNKFTRLQPTDRYGDDIPVKSKQTLRIAFQNIGGLPIQCSDIKEDYIRLGLSTWDFDIFGLVQTNLDWHLIDEDNKLWARTREWWEHTHISHAHNNTSTPITEKQYGGTAIFTINNIAHRVADKGCDGSGLGRWSWTKLRGKKGHILTIITAYRPNPPSAGVMGVYTQHTKCFNSINCDICLREAFLTNLKQEITLFQEAGSHIIVMLDGNEDMHRGLLSQTFNTLQLREVILQCHRNRAHSTYRRNTNEVPIDGIWASLGIEIKAGGYFAFDEIMTGTDHRSLWVNISYMTAFGYDGNTLIIHPSARKLNNKTLT